MSTRPPSAKEILQKNYETVSQELAKVRDQAQELDTRAEELLAAQKHYKQALAALAGL